MDTCELASRIRDGSLTPSEATRSAIDRIEKLNPKINAVVTPLFDAAKDRAKVLDAMAAEGRFLGPLHGVPVLIKDLFDPLAGVRNTFGCVATKDFVPDATATHVQRLIDAGAIVVGKTNTPEFGHKGITDNRLFGPTCCPFDLSRNAGGSSGGSAAAVAAGMVTLAQGSDAGGSIRIPAAWCGVVGFKPSYGRIPNGGGWNVFGSHTPFVHTGPLTATVRDAALAASVMIGPADDDPFSLPSTGEDLLHSALAPIPPLRVKYSANFGAFPVDSDVRQVTTKAIEILRYSADVTISESKLRFSTPQQEMAELWRRQVGLAYADMFASLSPPGKDFLELHAEDVPPPIHEMVEAARRQSALGARRDEALRTTIYRELQAEMKQCDILLTPTLGAMPVANAAGGDTLGPSEVAGEPTEPTIGWCLTHLVNFTGHPAASVPAGFSPEGLPVGLQIIGRRHRDSDVIAMAAEIERAIPWRPQLESLRASLLR